MNVFWDKAVDVCCRKETLQVVIRDSFINYGYKKDVIFYSFQALQFSLYTFSGKNFIET